MTTTSPPPSDPATDSASAAIHAPAYDTFDEYLKLAVKEYYQRSWKAHRSTFVALVIASGQVASLARDAVTSDKGLRNVALGAAGVVALRLGLRFVLTGPLGILVGAATVASLIAYFIKNQREITARLERVRDAVGAERVKFEEIQTGYRANRYDARERSLMVEGQLKRFLTELDEIA